MEKLKQALTFGGILSDTDIDYVFSQFDERKLAANEHFHTMHAVANEIAFVDEGILRAYTIDQKGTEVTKYFVRENQFAVDLDSYYASVPGIDGIQAVVASKIMVIHKSVMTRLHEELPNFYIFLKSLSEAHLLNKLKDNDFLNFGDSKTKYNEFVKRYPALAQQVPQQYIASYLKITPQSLSRIRKEIGGR